GFTLVEVAISLIILGCLIAPLVMLYNNYLREKKVETTYKNVQSAVDAVQRFRQLNGHYPCPAPLNVPQDFADVSTGVIYGEAHPFACDGVNGNPSPSIAVGNCQSGVC